MNILEKEIEDLLFDALVNEPQLLLERGFIHGFCNRYEKQPDLGSYGRPDIIGYTIRPKKNGYRIISVEIIELKKDDINVETLLQACRYATGLKRYFNSLNLKNTQVSISINLLGRTIDKKSDFVFLLQQMTNTVAYTFEFSLQNGMDFISHSGYFKNNESLERHRMTFSTLKEVASLEYESFYEEERDAEPVNFPF